MCLYKVHVANSCHGIAEAAQNGEPGGEGAAEGEAAAEAAPAAEEGEEGEGEGGPPKPDYSKNTLEYVVTSTGQVHTAPCHSCSLSMQLVCPVYPALLKHLRH